MVVFQVAGAVAIFAAFGHGFLGDKTLREQPIDPSIKNFTRCCYQFGTAGWIAAGVVLLLAGDDGAVGVNELASGLIPLFAFAAITNLWFTKGKHFGWVLLAAVCVLIGIGAF